jgi:hypothetical protein
VLDRIFDERLEQERRNFGLLAGLFYLKVDRQPIGKPHLLDGEVHLLRLDFLVQAD